MKSNSRSRIKKILLQDSRRIGVDIVGCSCHWGVGCNDSCHIFWIFCGSICFHRISSSVLNNFLVLTEYGPTFDSSRKTWSKFLLPARSKVQKRKSGSFNFLILIWLQEAKKAIRFYKGFAGESVEVTNALCQEYDRLVAIAARNTKKTNSITMQTLRKPAVYSGILIGIILTMLNNFSGSFILIVYGVMIFQKASTRIDPYISSIILASLQVVGTLASTSLVEVLGRKSLMIISMAGCTIGFSAMAAYMYLSSVGYGLGAVDWIPVVSLGFVVFISSVGIIPLTFLCIIESLPMEVRPHYNQYHKKYCI